MDLRLGLYCPIRDAYRKLEGEFYAGVPQDDTHVSAAALRRYLLPRPTAGDVPSEHDPRPVSTTHWSLYPPDEEAWPWSLV